MRRPQRRTEARVEPLTDLLTAWSQGDDDALAELAPLVQGELHLAARRALRRERPAHTLQATALVNEAFLRLADQKRVTWRDRGHFLAVATECIKRVLVDYARRRNADRRGAGVQHVELEHAEHQRAPSAGDDLAALDAALRRLESLDARQARIVELRYFGGLTVEETATMVRISPATVKREWTAARMWLFRELSRSAA